MVERLKQIWGGFERETTRQLTGRGVDNIAVPHRRDWRGEEEVPRIAGAPPARAAFEALQERLAAQWKKSGRRRDEEAAEDLSQAFEADGARDLLRGLKATEARIVRSERLYDADAKPAKRSLFGGRTKTEKKGFRLF